MGPSLLYDRDKNVHFMYDRAAIGYIVIAPLKKYHVFKNVAVK